MFLTDRKPPICKPSKRSVTSKLCNCSTRMDTSCYCHSSDSAPKQVYEDDMYGRILGPTPDETILAGLQTVIDMCSSGKSPKNFKIDSKKIVEWVNSQYQLLEQEMSSSALTSSNENIEERKENLQEIEELVRRNAQLERLFKGRSGQTDNVRNTCMCQVSNEEDVEDVCCCGEKPSNCDEETSTTSSSSSRTVDTPPKNGSCSCSSKSSSPISSPKYRETSTQMSRSLTVSSESECDCTEELTISRKLAPPTTRCSYVPTSVTQSTNSTGTTIETTSTGSSFEVSNKSVQAVRIELVSRCAQTIEERKAVRCKCAAPTQHQASSSCKCVQTSQAASESSSSSCSLPAVSNKCVQTCNCCPPPRKSNSLSSETFSCDSYSTDSSQSKVVKCALETSYFSKSTQTFTSSPRGSCRCSPTQQTPPLTKTCISSRASQCCNCQRCGSQSAPLQTSTPIKKSAQTCTEINSIQTPTVLVSSCSDECTSGEEASNCSCGCCCCCRKNIEGPRSSRCAIDNFTGVDIHVVSSPTSCDSASSSDRCCCSCCAPCSKRLQVCSPENCSMLKKGVINIGGCQNKSFSNKASGGEKKIEMCQLSTCRMLKEAVVNIFEEGSCVDRSSCVDQGTGMSNLIGCNKKTCTSKCLDKKASRRKCGTQSMEMYNCQICPLSQNKTVHFCRGGGIEKKASLSDYSTIQYKYQCKRKEKVKSMSAGYGDCGEKTPPAGEVRFAMVKITAFPEYSTFEILKSSNTELKTQSSRIESVFVLKNKHSEVK